jgi:hypothetical protein
MKACSWASPIIFDMADIASVLIGAVASREPATKLPCSRTTLLGPKSFKLHAWTPGNTNYRGSIALAATQHCNIEAFWST